MRGEFFLRIMNIRCKCGLLRINGIHSKSNLRSACNFFYITDYLIMKHSFLVYIFLWYVKRITIFLLVSFGNFRNCSRGWHETFFRQQKIRRKNMSPIFENHHKSTDWQDKKWNKNCKCQWCKWVTKRSYGCGFILYFDLTYSENIRHLLRITLKYFALNAIINFHRRKNRSKNTTW